MIKTLGSFLLLVAALAVLPIGRAQSQEPIRPVTAAARRADAHKGYGTHFQTSDRCVACHNGITTTDRRGHLDRRQLADQHDGQRRPRSRTGWRACGAR